MLTYRLEDKGDLPLYEYLYRCIRRDILTGNLTAGEKLPSKRSLAAHLDLSVITVENAYAQLITEGYVRSAEKRGYFVEKIEAIDSSEYRASSTGQSTPTCQLCNSPAIVADFRSNAVSESLFPYSTWSKMMREVLSEQKDGLLAKAPSQGVYELRAELAGYLLRFRGLPVDPEQIIIGAGTEYLYNLLISLFGPGHTYAVENPGYSNISRIYRNHGVPVEHIALDEQGLSVSELRKTDATIVHISPSHHFPTGIVMPVGRRQELLRWAEEAGNRYIIEDDYDSEFRFSGRPMPPMQYIDRQGKVIYMNTFSKTLTPSIRISYMVLPKSLLARYRETLGFYSNTVSNFEQYTLAAFIRGGAFEQHINRMRTAYRHARNDLLREIHSVLPEGRYKIQEENAGLHFLLSLVTSYSDDELKCRAGEKGLILSFLSDYYNASLPPKEHTVLMNYSGLTAAAIREGVSLLAELIEE